MLRLRVVLAWFPGVLTLLSTLPARAEAPREQGTREAVTFTTNVVAPFVGVYPIEAHVRVGSRFALVVNGSHFSLRSGAWSSSVTAVGAGVSYYFLGTALRRWYVEGIAEALFGSWHYERDSSRVSSIVVGSSLSALLGYRFVCDVGPVLDLGLGVARVHLPSGTAEPQGERASSGAVTRYYPAPKINVGWAF